MQESAVRQLSHVRVNDEASGVPALPWLTAGAIVGLASGALTTLLAIAASLAAGLPWHRPLNVVASLSYGPHLAVADTLHAGWLTTAAALSVPAMLASGLLYGTLVAALGFRPSRWLALKLGLLIGLSVWLLTVKTIAPVVSPLTVRLVPLWVTVPLFAAFGLGLAGTTLLAPLLDRLTASPTPEDGPAPPLPQRPSRVIPQ